jgi:hypothetical protein
MAKLVYITYSNQRFRNQQIFNVCLARLLGSFDRILSMGPCDIDASFREENQEILGQEKGGGYWLWKPYIIRKVLNKLDEGDCIFYADAGSFFVKRPVDFFRHCQALDQDLIAFELPLIEKQWTKSQLFLSLECNDDYFRETNQVMAGFIFAKNSKFTRDFFDEFLSFAMDPVNITDKMSSVGQCREFIAHRHDQSIFSLLYKKYKLHPLPDITQYGLLPQLYIDASCRRQSFRVGDLKICNGRLFRLNQAPSNCKSLIFLSRGMNPLLAILYFIISKFKNSRLFMRF